MGDHIHHIQLKIECGGSHVGFIGKLVYL